MAVTRLSKFMRTAACSIYRCQQLYAINTESDRRYISRTLLTQCRFLSAHKDAGILTNQLTMSEDGFRAEVVLPGYGYSDINRAGHVAMWATLHADGSLRMRLLQTTESVTAELSKNLLFVFGHHYHFMPAFYRQSTHFQPVRTITDCAFFGNSSYDYHHTGISAKTGEILHSGRTKAVIVDKTTRKSMPVPQKTAARFRKTSLFETLKPMAPFEHLSMPVEKLIHKTEMTIQPSDADYYLHTNHVAYPRLCHDAGSLVAMERKLRHFPRDLAFYPVKELTCLYQSETRPGDKVNVNVWEEQPMVLKFIVKKQDDTLIFQCTMSFYESVTSNL